jgi:hypothetical protein
MALVNDNDIVIITGFEDPALDGEAITLTCPPGWILNGSSSSTCTRNGEWEPDPRDVNCIGALITTGTPIILRMSQIIVAMYLAVTEVIIPELNNHTHLLFTVNMFTFFHFSIVQ